MKRTKRMHKRCKEEPGKLIRQLREEKGQSQMALAKKLGMSYQQLQKYERGSSELSISRFIQIFRTLGVNGDTALSELYGRLI